jgi:hypothetical protein
MKSTFRELTSNDREDVNEDMYFTRQASGLFRTVFKGKLELTKDSLIFSPYSGEQPVQVKLSDITAADFTSVISSGRFIITANQERLMYHTAEPFTIKSLRFLFLRRISDMGSASAIKGAYWRKTFHARLPNVTTSRDEVQGKNILIGVIMFIVILVVAFYLLVHFYAAS